MCCSSCSRYEYTVGLVNPVAVAILAIFAPSPAIRLIISTCSSVEGVARALVKETGGVKE